MVLPISAFISSVLHQSLMFHFHHCGASALFLLLFTYSLIFEVVISGVSWQVQYCVMSLQLHALREQDLRFCLGIFFSISNNFLFSLSV